MSRVEIWQKWSFQLAIRTNGVIGFRVELVRFSCSEVELFQALDCGVGAKVK